MTFVAGLGLGLSLIVAIGAQNVFVLRQGIRRDHVVLVVAICAVSDALLIVAGVSGIGLAVAAAPWLFTAARWAGGAFLVAYGVLAARRAWRGMEQGLDGTGHAPASGDLEGPQGGRRSRRSPAVGVAVTCLALTWLNPHVYLDTVFLLGSIAATHGDSKWLFAAGAVTGSVLWFSALGYGARYVGRWLAGPQAWRMLDGFIAVVMIVIAVSLVRGV